MAPDPHDRAQVARFVDAIGAGVVATATADAGPEAAYVGLAALDDGTLIFNTREDARKVANLRANGRIAVVVTGVHDVSVQIEGEAAVFAGADRAQYGAAYNDRFPGSRALADGFVMVAVRPDWARVYDASQRPASVAEARW